MLPFLVEGEMRPRIDVTPRFRCKLPSQNFVPPTRLPPTFEVMRALTIGVMSLVCGLQTAHADDTVTISSHGIELEMPGDWIQTKNKDALVLAPKSYRGRAVQIQSLPSMPKDRAELQKLVVGDDAGVAIRKADLIARNGVTMMVAAAHMKGDSGSGDVEFDLVIVPVGAGATMVMSGITAGADPVLRKANQAVLLSARLGGRKMSVTYEKPRLGKGAPDAFVKAMQATVQVLDQAYAFPRPLPVHFKDCGFSNAFYSPAHHDLTLCHELFDELRETFGDAKAKDVEGLVRNTMLFVFFHEFGHALVGELDLPTTGNAEDVADELASLVLVELGETGQEAVTAAAFWFKLMAAEQGAPKPDSFYRVHSYDETRVGNLVCALYAADPKRYGELVHALGMPDSRLSTCAREYPTRIKSWHALLGTHMRKTHR
jgi:hypothetical protein